MRIRYPAPIEKPIQEATWSFAEHLYKQRGEGATCQQLAEANDVHRSTARRYAHLYEKEARRNGYIDDHAPSCNELRCRCVVCSETFTATRGDARYCSGACRQDAYRKRRVGYPTREAVA